MTRYSDARKLKFLMGDLRAALWVLHARELEDDDTLLRRFFAIHEFFLRNIGRSRPELFQKVDRSFLTTVVRGWVDMYLKALRVLRSQFPRIEGSTDLQALGTNWSEELQISFEGLIAIDFASRYAEFWGERSISDRTVFESYEERLAFVGSSAYLETFELFSNGELLLLDDFSNGVTPFDLILALEGRETDDARTVFESHGWYVVKLTPHAIDVLKGFASSRD